MGISSRTVFPPPDYALGGHCPRSVKAQIEVADGLWTAVAG
jgi:hypothetical protein